VPVGTLAERHGSGAGKQAYGPTTNMKKQEGRVLHGCALLDGGSEQS
jgi:hypothetical protein